MTTLRKDVDKDAEVEQTSTKKREKENNVLTINRKKI